MSEKKDNKTTKTLSSSYSPSNVALPAESKPPVGLLLDDRYLIEKEVRYGAYRNAYIARDSKLSGHKVVIKLFQEEVLKNEWAVQKARQEIKALARLNDPVIASIFEAGELNDGTPYIVMEYVEGVDLRSCIKGEGMPFERVATILRQVGRTITLVHDKEILHGDLKPENIILRGKDGEEQVMLIDFGIAKVMSSMSPPGIIVGTLAYMSPEQLRGKNLSTVSDIYTLGIIAYEMLTGRRPFNPDSPNQLLEMQKAGVKVKPTELRPDLPEMAEKVILCALSFDPHERFMRAQDFGDALSQALQPNKTSKKLKPTFATTLEASTEIVLLSDKLTPHYLSAVLSPYLNAVAEIQDIINEIQGRTFQEVVIKSIKQNSPINISLAGAAEAIQQIKCIIVPWRRKHEEKMALLLEKEKQAEIGNKKAEILEKRARSTKDSAEAERVSADAAKLREETESLRLKNEELRLELQRARIQLALDVLAQVAPNLSETEKIAYVVKLLPPLDIIASRLC